MLAAAAFVGDHRGVELGADGGPVAAVAAEEALGGAGDLDGEVDGAVGERDRALEREGEAAVGPVAGAGEDGEDAAEAGVVADGEEVELVAVVVGREAGGLLVGVGGEGREAGLGAVGEVLLAAGDQGLLEPAADRTRGRAGAGRRRSG